MEIIDQISEASVFKSGPVSMEDHQTGPPSFGRGILSNERGWKFIIKFFNSHRGCPSFLQQTEPHKLTIKINRVYPNSQVKIFFENKGVDIFLRLN
jgi:hypothetical protein